MKTTISLCQHLLLALLIVPIFTACQNTADNTLTSPDKSIQLQFILTPTGSPQYAVSKDKAPVILPSHMGFITQTANLTQGFQHISTQYAHYDQTWETVWGEERYIRDYYHQMTIHLQHTSGLHMDIIFRLFNDGFAFQYHFPDTNQDTTLILREATEYRFAHAPEAWSIPWRTEYYEALWNKAPIAQIDTACSPITLQWQDGTYAFLHEAALTDYPAQNFYCQEDTIRTFLTPMSNGIAAYKQGAWSTPWRFMTLADNIQQLTASRIMLNLNEPCRIEDTSWIKPMKFIGIWWGMHLKTMTWWNGPQHGATTQRMKQYIDFAADNNIGGVLAEGWNVGWGSWDGPHKHERFSFVTPYPDYDIDYLAQYAHSKDIQIIFHHETAGDAANYETQLDTAYQYIQSHGMHAVKTGYVSPYIRYQEGKEYSRSQIGVRHYRKVIETAAAHQVAIDNHEPVMPTGLQRTYPNLMTQEGIRGQEWNAWANDGGSPTNHVTILPFTRMLAGPADYTPGVFNFDNPVHPNTRVHATLANQLGLFVVLYSPLQMACDLPENYLRYPEAFDFIRQVPCDWQQSRLLAGEIGEFAVMARQDRHSPNWYIGAVNNDTPRQITIDYSFLADGEYTLTRWQDDPTANWQTNPYAIHRSTHIIIIQDGQVVGDHNPHTNLYMAAGGGMAMIIQPK